MAVVAQPPLENKLAYWGSSGNTSSYKYPAPSSESMTDIMSYQYPPPPQNGADLDMTPSSYMSNYPVPPPSSSMEVRPQEPSMSLKDRRESISKMIKLKRSMSTPNVRPAQTPPDHSAALAADKRRNKLGYHRTSVACGHCRRRKIRCIPSPSDVQGRCVNCIRLKKECSFYPVDQQQIPEYQRTKQPPQRSSTGGKISASSSPALPSGQPNDYAHMPPIMAPPATKPSGDRYSPDSKARGYDYAPPTANTNWMSSDASPSSSKPGELNATWRSYPPESPAFSPYTPHAPPHSATWATPSDSGSREDMWQSSYPPPPPTRTMSQGGESMSSYGQYPAPPHGSSGRPYDRKSASMSEMYPPPIVTSAMDGSATSAVDPHGSLSAGAVPPPTYGSWQPPYSYSSKPGESPYGSSGWYGENSTSSHVGSEEPTSAADATAPSSSIYYGSR